MASKPIDSKVFNELYQYIEEHIDESYPVEMKVYGNRCIQFYIGHNSIMIFCNKLRQATDTPVFWMMDIFVKDDMQLSYSLEYRKRFDGFIEESHEMDLTHDDKSRYLMSILQCLIVSGSTTKGAK
mgnify:CR=1 FL=1|tara:strand:+ start:35571 stop:35948 length:378 start_codon:yes stop_codon:yes gene_type:complete